MIFTIKPEQADVSPDDADTVFAVIMDIGLRDRGSPATFAISLIAVATGEASFHPTPGGSVIGVACIFIGVQLLDATLITPRILGGKLGLPPLWIIVALMAGGEMFGFLGVLLAVPTTAVLKVVITHTVERYKASNLFLSPTAPKQPAAAPATASQAPSPPEDEAIS